MIPAGIDPCGQRYPPPAVVNLARGALVRLLARAVMPGFAPLTAITALTATAMMSAMP